MAVLEYEKKVERIKRAIADKQATINSVEQRRSASQQVVDKLNSSRSQYVMAARVTNDPQAQKQLNDLHDGVEVAQREQRDDDAALALLNPQLQTLLSALPIAELNVEREHARELIRARMKLNLEEEVAGLVLKAKQLLEQIRNSTNEIGRAVFAFDDEWGRKIINDQFEPFRLDAGSIPLAESLERFANSSSRFERILARIEDVNVPGEPEEVAVS